MTTPAGRVTAFAQNDRVWANTFRTNRFRTERGQATVEFALSLSALVVAVLMVAQIMVIGRDQLLVELVARNAAREASVAADTTGAAERSAARLLPDRAHRVSTSTSDRAVTVKIEMPVSARLPIVGIWLGNIELRASSTMPVEPPEPTEDQSGITTMSQWSYEPEPMWSTTIASWPSTAWSTCRPCRFFVID